MLKILQKAIRIAVTARVRHEKNMSASDKILSEIYQPFVKTALQILADLL